MKSFYSQLMNQLPRRLGSPGRRILWIQLLVVVLSLTVMGLWLPRWIGSDAVTLAQSQPLTLQTAEPASGQTNVPLDKVFQLNFDGSLPEVESLELAIEPDADLIFDIQSQQLLLQAADPLDYSTDYTITIPNQGNLPLTEAVVLSFRTEPQYTYDEDVQPLLDARCVGCHQPAGRQRRSPLHTYEAVLNYVKPGDNTSELIQERWTQRHATPARDGQGSPEYAYARRLGVNVTDLGFWTPEQVELVTTWIVQDEAAENRGTAAEE